MNPYDVQSRCSVCSNLVPDIVYEEHKQTCWANTDNKRVGLENKPKMLYYLIFSIENFNSNGEEESTVSKNKVLGLSAQEIVRHGMRLSSR